MTFCKVGEKPKVIYKFAEGERIYQSDKSPIEVVVSESEQTNFTGGQCQQWYGIIYSTAEGQVRRSKTSGVGVRGPIFSLQLYYQDRGNVLDWAKYAWVALVGGYQGDDAALFRASFPNAAPNSSESKIGLYYLFLNYAIYGKPALHGIEPYNPSGGNPPFPLDNCGNPPKICKLEIKYNGTTIFSDIGSCPCTFTVQCEDCPEGTVRCECPGYPGYCCLPCQPIILEIKSIRTLVKRLQ